MNFAPKALIEAMTMRRVASEDIDYNVLFCPFLTPSLFITHNPHEQFINKVTNVDAGLLLKEESFKRELMERCKELDFIGSFGILSLGISQTLKF